jgi:hypothetical protein
MSDIFEIILIWIFSYPGAWIRWMISGRKKSMEDYRNDDWYFNSVFVILLVVLLILVIKGLALFFDHH